MGDNRFNAILFANSMPATKFKLLGVVLLFAVFNSQALTLGRMRGAALVGQGLDVTIQVQADGDEAPSSQCFEADVFHADTRQEPSRVQVIVEPAQTARNFNLRVVSSAAVDEPVVTVYLRSLCAQKTSRRYVMLADVVSDQLPSSAPRVAQVPLLVPAAGAAFAPSVAAPDSALTASAANLSGAGPAKAARTGASAASRRARPAAAAKPAPAAASRKAALPKPAPARHTAPAAPSPAPDEKLQAGRSAGQSRLKLDPLEVLSERVATLESSTASAPAEIAARDAQRLQSLENSVKSLLTVATRNEASLTDMKARLQQAESERYRNPQVYGLLLLLLLCLASIGFLLTRRGRQASAGSGNWWSGSATVLPTIGASETSPATARSSGFSPMSAPSPLVAPGEHVQMPQQTQQIAPRSVQAPVTQVDVSLVEMSESTFDRLMQSGATHSAVRKPRPAEPLSPGIRKSINSEELFDIRQQAEFFVSLGQTDQAVRILENRISESGESSPLAYLDLLKIFHSLGLRADFRQVREDFNLLFNAKVPEFSNFNHEGKSLDDYPDVLSEITASWGTPAVFTVIEMCLFRDQWKSHNEIFDLAAFRELLLLHAVAQSVASPTDSAFGVPIPGNGFPSAPVPAGYGDTRQGVSARLPQVGPASGPLPLLDGVPEVDIDLSDLHISLPVAEAPVPAAEKTAADIRQRHRGEIWISGAGVIDKSG